MMDVCEVPVSTVLYCSLFIEIIGYERNYSPKLEMIISFEEKGIKDFSLSLMFETCIIKVRLIHW